MPKTKRDMLRRQVAHAYNNLTLAMEHLGTVHDKFDQVHQEYADHLMAVISTIDVARDMVHVFIKSAWDALPEEMFHWRNVGERRTKPEKVD